MSRRHWMLVAGVGVVAGCVLLFALLRRGAPVVVIAPTAAPAPTASPFAADPTIPVATPTTSPPRTPLPTRPRVQFTAIAQAGVVAPVVVERSPARGEALAPDQPVKLVFDRAMNQSTVERALQVAGVQGTTEWSDARTVSFRPATPWSRDAVYDVVLGQEAQAEDGAVLDAPYQFRFATSGFLDVAQVIPAQGTGDAAATSVLTVVFNRPVVALTGAEQMARQPQPLRLVREGEATPVAGTGEWLNTSVYVFRPTNALLGGARYTGTVDAGLVDTDGNPLREAYRWDFVVATPQVLYTVPEQDAKLVGVERSIAVTLNQPVNANGRVRVRSGDAEIAGTMGTVGDTLVFTPTGRLAFDTLYTAEVGSESGLVQPFRWQFRTVPLPRVVGTTPRDGTQKADPARSFQITFNAPINPTTVMSNLTWTPPLSATRVYTYYNEYERTFDIGYDPQPSANYQVRIGPGIADPYGNMTGQTIDVRFRTDQLPPSVQLVSTGPVGTYDAGRPTQIVLRSVNKTSATLALYRATVGNVIQPRWYESPPQERDLVRRWDVALQSPLDELTTTRVDVAEGGGTLAPGAYVLALEDIEDSWQRYHTMIVSPLNLTLKAGDREAMVWANRLSDGAPAPNVPITFYTGEQQKLGTATTDADGIARITFEPPMTWAHFAFADGPYGAIGTGWGMGTHPYEWGVNLAYNAPTQIMTIYTDRAIYRPGQTVHFKGALRDDRDVRYTTPPAGTPIGFVVRGPEGQEIARLALRLSDVGTFAGDIELPEGSPLGTYWVGDDQRSFPFTVAAYRPPEFEVVVTPPAPETVRGSAAQATAEVRYFFGGPVANVKADWHVLATPYRFEPAGLERYTFTDDDDPWLCFDCWWQPAPQPTPILTGTAMTDARGTVAIPIPATLRWNDGQPITSSVRLQIETTATGNDNSFLSGRAEMIVHEAGVYAGLSASTSVATAEQPVSVDLVAVDTKGTRRPNQQIVVSVERREWTNRFIADSNGGGRWESEERRMAVTQQTVTTNNLGEAVFRWTPDQGGSYHVVARTSDGTRTATSSIFVWVAGRDDVPWRRSNDDKLTLISDRTRYAPGDTASILIPSPFEGPTWALVTVERGGILQHEVLELQSASTVYKLPITAQHAPNIYFNVVLVTGPAGERRTADYKLGLLPLLVDPVPQTVKVTLQRDGDVAVPPGSTVRYTVQTTDATGAPVAAELSLDLVDKAILSLLPREPDVLKTAFYGKRDLGIGTMSGLGASADRLLDTLLEQLARQGLPTTATEATEESAGMAGGEATAAPAAAGGGDTAFDAAPARGAAAIPGAELRENFADTAFWKADVRTDGSGRATVEIALPDNLTTWVLRGAAITADTKVGEATNEVIATKPLVIRPVTPRFLVVDDEVELAANVSNLTDRAMRATVVLNTKGLTVTTPLSTTVEIPARGEAKVTWNAVVGDVESVALVFLANAGSYSDAAKPRLATGPEGTLPVYRYAVPETTGTGGALPTAGARTEVVALPTSLDTRRGEVTLRLDPSLAAALRDGLDQLKDYLEGGRDHSNDEVVGAFLPAVSALRAMQQLGIDNPALEQNMPTLVSRAVTILQTRQHADGGWGWWDEAESNPQVSAYVVLGLAQAKAAGFAVDDAMLRRGGDYLRTQRESLTVKSDSAEADLQAFLAYVLAESDQDAGDLASLGDFREKMSAYARALLALAVAHDRPDDPLVDALLSDLQNSAIMSATGAHWEEDAYNPWAMNSDTRSTAIALLALARLDPQNQLTPNVVRWLMVARDEGTWASTQETAWSILALTAWMEQTGELDGNYEYAVALNERPTMDGQVTPDTVDQPLTQRIPISALRQDAGNRLQVGRGDGTGVLYYTAHLRAFLPVEEVRALDRGFTVRRRYTLASCTDGPRCPEVREVKVGDVIRVDLTIVSPSDRYYLRVEDPLPAGAEAVDTGLATTSILAQGPRLQRENEGNAPLPWMGWWNWYSRSEVRDEKMVLLAPFIAKGTYEYSYTIRATQSGRFQVIPTTATETYFPEVYGRGDGQVLTIR
jgi:alpha-2-macroglobulin